MQQIRKTPATPRGNNLLTAALAYAARGWPVLPLHHPVNGGCSCGKNCGSPGKHPRTPNGWKDGTTDFEVIRGWWKTHPQANIGVVVGISSQLAVLDVDPRNGGDETLGDLEAEYGPLPHTVEAITGGGGRHVYFQHPGTPLRSRVLKPGVELKGDAGFVVAPPSRHASGKPYAWDLEQHPEDVPLAALPAWLASSPRPGPAPPVGEAIPKGARNQTLTSLAGSMRRRGMTEEELLVALREVNAARCAPPLEDEELRQIAGSVARYPPANASPDWARADRSLGLEPEPLPEEAPRVIKVASLSDLLAADLPPRVDIVKDFLTERGLAVLGGLPASGKSMLALNLALAVAAGKPWLGFPTRASGVLVLSYEGGKRLVRERAEKMVAGAGQAGLGRVFPWSPEECSPVYLDSEQDREALIAFCREQEIGLVIVDPLVRAHQGSENDPEDMGNLVRALGDLRNRGRVAVLLLHHLRKPGKDARTGSGVELRGHSIVHGETDSVASLEARRGDKGNHVLRFELRWAEEPPPFLLHLDPDTLTFERVGSLEARERRVGEDEAFNRLREAGQVTVADFASLLGVGDKTARQYLADLKSKGRARTFQPAPGTRAARWTAVDGDGWEEVDDLPF